MFRRFSVLLILSLMLLAACAAPQETANAPASGGSQAQPAQATPPAAAPATVQVAATQPASAATSASQGSETLAPTDVPLPATTAATAQPAGASSSAASAGGPMRLVLVPQGTEARYRAREVLAGRTLPSDAIGRTNAVTGQIVIQPDGKLVSDQSKVSVDLSTLQSDQAMRDGFIKRSTLEVSQYPTAEFVPKSVEGLPSPLPTSGDVNFTITGDMTVHGVTKPATWQVTGKVSGNEMTGTATYGFTFADFNLRKPQVPRVLSLEDAIKLELDFHLVKQ